MTKTVEVVHYQVERYVLTQRELIEALESKYGKDCTFVEGRLVSVHCSTIMPGGSDGHDTEVVFKRRLSETAEAVPV